MVDVTEAASQRRSALSGALGPGVSQISGEQEITFTKYVRVVLPVDGFVFWVRADQLTAGAIYAATRFAALSNAGPGPGLENAAPTFTAKGSLHFATEQQQDEAEGFAINRVVFTAREDVERLNRIEPNCLWVGEFGPLTFAFSRRSKLYVQSGLWHYQGDAVYPSMKTQLIQYPDQLDLTTPVVSNSLPAWLALNQFCPMYPSFVVPDNIEPPWCSVHIDPSSTRALGMAPYIDAATGSHYQLCTERVRLTLYGLRNPQALDFLDYILASMGDGSPLGLMNSPVPRDEKRTQAELNILAQKKVIEFEVSYQQTRIQQVAQQLITQAFMIFGSIPPLTFGGTEDQLMFGSPGGFVQFTTA